MAERRKKTRGLDRRRRSDKHPIWWNRLHRLWTKAVGKEGYNKREWEDFENHLDGLLGRK